MCGGHRKTGAVRLSARRSSKKSERFKVTSNESDGLTSRVANVRIIKSVLQLTILRSRIGLRMA